MHRLKAESILNPEIRPFIPALNIFLSRLSGIVNSDDPELDFLEDLSELKEQHLVSHVLTMTFLRQRITNGGEEWDICMEPFSAFEGRSERLSIIDIGFENSALQTFFQWFISLCNWESNLISTTPIH
ncbi:hypothetical protein L2728_00980 [Shewanella chilikensis]|uniref:hypothetical protein n=1 Tax=Shewanella chilikensis TaxID=558541 RepID=UPI00200CE9A3|nr:hypothetical protein [Shewanella chilikensis]MCL1160468.1 hypothetical protein [Shewanella chilikensis]